MTKSDDRKHGIGEARTTALGAAILRINASLDLDAVLHEVVDSARTLTGARYGLIAGIDDTGQPRDIVTSGLTPEEHRQVLGWADGMGVFEHLRDLPGPLRLSDLPGFVRSLGNASDLVWSQTLLATPMCHRDEHVGHFFLAGKQGGEEFTGEDEEILTLFASQAALAITNASTHRAERRARADLEALVETSPVGVVVFDAESGRVVSINREARRIAESLRLPGCPPEQLLEVMSFRRADGSVVNLGELSIGQLLQSGETMRDEEVVLSVPDGRSIRTLVNATPVHAEDGAVRSLVLTVQDLAPLDEIERMRTEFLGLVSHELREPLAAIKGSAATLLEDAATLDPVEMREFHRIIATQAAHMRRLIGDLLDAGRIESGTLTITPEPSDLAELVERARSTFSGSGGRHGIVVDLPAELPWALADRQRVVQILVNLFANAARHAPESSPIRVAAVREGARVAVSVGDEGRGVTPDRLRRFFSKHGGAGEDGASAGHGLGLAICKGLVEAHGGRIRAESAGPRHGATVTFTLLAAGEAGGAAAVHSTSADGEGAGKTPILVVDDDPRMLRFVRESLSRAGYDPLVTGEAQELEQIIRIEQPRLVLLDMVLPGVDGIELMQEIRNRFGLPVIFISAYGRDETVARALDLGAEDYLVKPFSPTELVARVRAALGRSERPEPFVLGALAIDYARRRVTVGGDPVALTATEYELLRVLSLDAGRVVPFDTLIERIWKGKGADANRVRIFVRNLRRKLGDDAEHPDYVFSERGVGYRMPDPGES